MPGTIVQDLGYQTITSSGDTLTITGVAAGNAILIGLGSTSSGNRSFAPTSNLDGAMTVSVDDDPTVDRISAIFALMNARAGNHAFDFGWIGGVIVRVRLMEVSGIEATGAISRQYTEPSSTNSHQMAGPSAPINTSGGAFFFGVGVLKPTTGDQTALGSWNELSLSANGNQIYTQYKDEAAAVSNEFGAWQGSGSARIATSTMVAFPHASGGGGSTVNIAAAMTGSSSMSAAALRRRGVVSPVLGASTMAASVARKRSASAVVPGASTLAVASGRRRRVASLLAAAAGLTAGSLRRRGSSATLSAASAAFVAVARRRGSVAVLAASSTIAVVVSGAGGVAATIAAASSIAISAVRRRAVSATLAGASSVASASRRLRGAPATLAGSSTVSVAPQRRRTAIVTLAGVSGVSVAVSRRLVAAVTASAVSGMSVIVRRARLVGATIAAVSTWSVDVLTEALPFLVAEPRLEIDVVGEWLDVAEFDDVEVEIVGLDAWEDQDGGYDVATKTFDKTPTEVLKVGVNWSKRLRSQGATISTSTWTTPSGSGVVTLGDASAHDDTRTTVLVSGGTTGTVYPITNRIVTSDGQTLERKINIDVGPQ